MLFRSPNGAGKTTLFSLCATQIHPSKGEIKVLGEKLGAVDVFELRPRVADWVAMQTRPANLQGDGEISLRRLIKESLRMRPNDIVDFENPFPC